MINKYLNVEEIKKDSKKLLKESNTKFILSAAAVAVIGCKTVKMSREIKGLKNDLQIVAEALKGSLQRELIKTIEEENMHK